MSLYITDYFPNKQRAATAEPTIRLEIVYHDEQLVECLLALVVNAAESGTTTANDAVDIIDKDYAWRIFLSCSNMLLTQLVQTLTIISMKS